MLARSAGNKWLAYVEMGALIQATMVFRCQTQASLSRIAILWDGAVDVAVMPSGYPAGPANALHAVPCQQHCFRLIA